VTIRRYLIRSINVLNLILFAAIALVFFYVLDPLLQASTAVKIPAAKETPLAVSSKGNERHQFIETNYAVIGDKNLFHPDRIIPPEKKTAVAPVRPDIVLQGTMITSQIKLAYVEDKKAPSTSSGRGTRQMALKEGDLIGGYKLKQITDKMIVLTNGEEQMTVYLDELKERKTETTLTVRPPSGLTPPMTTQTASTPSVPSPPPALPPAPTSVNPVISPQGVSRPLGPGASVVSPVGPAFQPPPPQPRRP
jgi:hypothetical protein